MLRDDSRGERGTELQHRDVEVREKREQKFYKRYVFTSIH
jgi:hypothetical protein